MKWSIRRKMNILIVTCIFVMTSILTIVNYSFTKNNLLESLETKLISDLSFSEKYIDNVYPGEWALVNGDLHKGDVNLVGDTEIVDLVKELTGGNAASIFQGDTRVSTNIVENGERTVGTQISDAVADVVLAQKQTFTGIANVLGEEHEAVYAPVFNSAGDVIGVWSTAVPTAPYIEIAKGSIWQNILIALVISLATVLIISLFVRNQIARPLDYLKKNATELANLNLNTKILNAKGNDEIADLASAFKEMQGRLKNTIQVVSDSSHQVASSSQLLAESSHQTSEASMQIAQTMNEIALGTTNQSDQVENIVRMMQSTIQQVEVSLQQAEETLHSAIDSTDIAKRGEAAINEAIKHLGTVTQTVSYATDSIQKLGKRSEEIGGIITAITGIAEQTNLLALNASIEAARAGEHGKGFAVVAAEVGQLADQSRKASGQITELIGDIQAETSVTVRTMESNLLAVEEQVTIITKGGEALEEIVARVTQTEQGVTQMKNAFAQINDNSHEVQNAIHDISKIIEDAAAATEEVAATSEEQSATVEEITGNSNELANISNSLRLEVEKFQV
ncbi:MAG: methyl-accepting chemotaxis protein [Solibacillus sp.]